MGVSDRHQTKTFYKFFVCFYDSFGAVVANVNIYFFNKYYSDKCQKNVFLVLYIINN